MYTFSRKAEGIAKFCCRKGPCKCILILYAPKISFFNLIQIFEILRNYFLIHILHCGLQGSLSGYCCTYLGLSYFIFKLQKWITDWDNSISSHSIVLKNLCILIYLFNVMLLNLPWLWNGLSIVKANFIFGIHRFEFEYVLHTPYLLRINRGRNMDQ